MPRLRSRERRQRDVRGSGRELRERHVGSNKTVTATGITLDGLLAGNYALLSPTATTTAAITAKEATGAVTAQDKTYDGTTAAIASCLVSGLVNGDSVTCAAAAASFANAAVGSNKTVTATGITLTVCSPGTTRCSRPPRRQPRRSRPRGDGAVTAQDKTYDGRTRYGVMPSWL